MRIAIKVDVERIPEILDKYDKISLKRSTTEDGVYTEIALITIVPSDGSYIYYDLTGTSTHWYKTGFYNSTSHDYSVFSAPFIADSSLKVGYTFENYSPPEGTWGEVLTADDIRYTYLWGLDLVANDSNKTPMEDSQIRYFIDQAISNIECDLIIDIKKRIYKTTPAVGLVKAVNWQRGVDYTDEEMPYDFKKQQWQNYGFVRLRHKPVVSVEKAEMFSAWDQKILDIIGWIRLYKRPGQIHIYPKGSTLFGAGYLASGIMMASPQMFSMEYPAALRFDYTTGFESSDYVEPQIRDVIGMLSSLKVLAWLSDGKSQGITSQSLGLDGLSESLSFTSSPSTMKYQARIEFYAKSVVTFVNTNKAKMGNIPMGFISGS